MFLTSNNEIIMYQMKYEASVHHFITYDYPTPVNAVGLTYTDFCYAK